MSKDEKKEEKIRQKPGKILYNNGVMLGRVARYIPVYPVFMVLEGLIWGGLNSAGTLFTVRLFNLLDKPGVTFSEFVVTILTMASLYAAAYLFDAWYWEYFNSLLHQKLQYHMQREMYEKARTVDLACYDDPAFYNDYVFAMDQARDRAWQVSEGVGKIINRLVASGTILTVLTTINPWIAVILAVNSLISIVINGYFNKMWYKKSREQKPMHRKNSYINRTYHLADSAKELRTSEVGRNLNVMYEKTVDELVATDLKYGKKMLAAGLLWDAVSWAVSFGVLFLAIFLLRDGSVALGGFAASISVMWQLGWLLTDLIERFQKLPEQSLYIEKYLAFLAYEPKVRGGERLPEEFGLLELEDVSFSYPFGEEKEVLSHVSMRVERGERIAFVGYNGAGKTTLTKLIMRFYDPTGGVIRYNGVDIREYNLEAYRAKIGAVFQDFKIFAATIAENVVNGPYREEDRERVQRALADAAFSEELEKLPKGIDTPLTKEFDEEGVNLSGGESQKIAIARIFAGEYSFIIMDEPSAALDPLAEYQLNHTILGRAADDGRTVLFISHRLSTTRMADRIYMFAEGKVAESGSHEELMALDGDYARMFRLQASKYREQAWEQETL